MITYQTRDLERICKDVTSNIESELSKVGLFFRIFSRVKSPVSVKSKILKKGNDYYGNDKLMRDIIGIRVIFYFSDDLSIVREKLKKMYVLVEETIDINEETKFAPTRINLVFKLSEHQVKEFGDIVNDPRIDSTFEIQLRTILSEGWHEVDHDLRYKCQNDWDNHVDLARNFNGILATLETSEYSTIRLFDQLSYRHYKAKDIVPMLRTKYRIRFENYSVSNQVSDVFNDELIKTFYKIERLDVLKTMFKHKILVPLTVDNVICIINYLIIKDENLLKITPSQIIEDLANIH